MESDFKDDVWRGLKSPTTWAIAVGKLGILFSRDAALLRSGEIGGDEFRRRAGGHVGSSAGLLLGAATGAALGILLPVVGNVAGAFTGGVLGAMAGEEVGRAAAGIVEKKVAPDATAEAASTGEAAENPTPRKDEPKTSH